MDIEDLDAEIAHGRSIKAAGIPLPRRRASST
jgi:hypothetical protein